VLMAMTMKQDGSFDVINRHFFLCLYSQGKILHETDFVLF